MSKNLFSIYDDPIFASYWNERAGILGEPYKRFVVDPIIFELLGDIAGKSVLELGCGNGYLARIFARKRIRKALCTDISQPLLDLATKSFRHNCVVFQRLDVTKGWDIKSKSIDAIVSNMMFNQIKDLNKPFAEALRVLKRRGRFVFSVTHPSWDLYVFAQERAGIKSKTITGMHGYFWRGYSTYLMGRSSKTRPDLFNKFARDFVVPHYHRPLADYFSALTEAGFVVTAVREPELNHKLLGHSPQFETYKDHPVGLIFACIKP